MILYDKDYAEQGAIVHYNTKNQSFLKMSVVLQSMGVKNNKFFLALYQKELWDVDPHDLKRITPEIAQRIAYECKINPWYFFREVIRVPSQGVDNIPYELNRANLALIWSYLNMIDIFLTMPRQLGKTVGTIGLMSFIMFIAGIRVSIGLFAKDNSLVLENVARLKIMRDGLPPYLISKSIADTDNKEGISYEQLGNKYITFIAQKDKRAAEGQGRGQTISVLHWDELAYYFNNHLSYPSATSASDTGAEQTKKSGVPVCNIITTTAGNLDDPAGRYAFDIKSRAFRFVEQLYDSHDRDKLIEVINANGNGMLYLEYSYKQLGKDDNWFKARTQNKSPDKIATDYLNTWLHGSGKSIIPAEMLQNISNSVTEPVDYSQSGPLAIRWYVPKHVLSDPKYKYRRFLIGFDSSDNVGRDFTTIVIVDPTDLSVIATVRCNTSNLVHVINCLMNLMQDLPNSILVPERNKNGAIIIDILIDRMLSKNIDPFVRIYNTFIQDYDANPINLKDVNLSDGNERKRFGFSTTSGSNSRDLLYKTVLFAGLKYSQHTIFDATLADEFKTLTERNGRIDHSIGGHDDTVISYLLTAYFVLFAKNHHMYGFQENEILNSVDLKGDKVDPVVKERQVALRKRIGELKALIISSTNDMLKLSYERELSHLNSLVDDKLSLDDIITADQAKQKVKENDDDAVFKLLNTPHLIRKLF